MSEFLEPSVSVDAESDKRARTLNRAGRDGAPGKRTLTSGLEGPDPKKGVKNIERNGSVPPHALEQKRETKFDNKKEVYKPGRVAKAAEKTADLAAEAALPDLTLAEYDSGERSAAWIKPAPTEFGDPNGLHGTAKGEVLDVTGHAEGSVKIAEGGLHVGGNAGGWATLAGGAVTVSIPDKSFTLLGEKVSARFDFEVGADAFAGADAKVNADIDLKGAGVEAKVSGFAGAKAVTSAAGELRWMRKPSQEYARRIAHNGLFKQTFGHLLPDFLSSVAESAVAPFIEILIDRMLTADTHPLVLGVTTSAEGSAGIGGSAGFSAGMRGGVLYCSGHAGLTLGLGAGYHANLALGVRDGMAMVALMALSGAGFLGDDLKPEKSWTDYVGEVIRNLVTNKTLVEFAKERTSYLFERKTEFGDKDGVHGKGVIRGGGLSVYADGRIEVADGGLHVSGNAGAKATLVEGAVEIVIADRPFSLLGEQLLGGAVFRVGAAVFAGAEGKVNADVDLTGAQMQANLSGFAGAKAIASAEGTLKWARRPTEEYARRIVEIGIYRQAFGNALPRFVERLAETQLRIWVKGLLDNVMSGAEPHPLVLGVNVTGEASAGIGASASFNASMRGGVIRCSGSAGLTMGLGAGYNFDVTIGLLDGMTMLAMMLLTGLDNNGVLSGSLKPTLAVPDFIRERLAKNGDAEPQAAAADEPQQDVQEHGSLPAPQSRPIAPEQESTSAGRGIGTRILDRFKGQHATSEANDAAERQPDSAATEAALPLDQVSSGTVIYEDWSGTEPAAPARGAKKRQRKDSRRASGPPVMLGPAPQVEPKVAPASSKPERRVKAERAPTASTMSHDNDGDMSSEQLESIAELGDVVAEGEGGYNSYNTGTRRDKKTGRIRVVHSGVKDLASMSVDQILATRSLPPEDRNRVFAAGKYQVILNTLEAAKTEIPLTGNELFTPELQERIFLEYLLGKKREGIADYIRHGQGTSDDATYLAAMEWASIEVPAGRRIQSGQVSNGHLSYYESGANHAKRGSGARIKAALEKAREAFARIRNGDIPEFERLPVEDDSRADR